MKIVHVGLMSLGVMLINCLKNSFVRPSPQISILLESNSAYEKFREAKNRAGFVVIRRSISSKGHEKVDEYISDFPMSQVLSEQSMKFVPNLVLSSGSLSLNLRILSMLKNQLRPRSNVIIIMNRGVGLSDIKRHAEKLWPSARARPTIIAGHSTHFLAMKKRGFTAEFNNDQTDGQVALTRLTSCPKSYQQQLSDQQTAHERRLSSNLETQRRQRLTPLLSAFAKSNYLRARQVSQRTFISIQVNSDILRSALRPIIDFSRVWNTTKQGCMTMKAVTGTVYQSKQRLRDIPELHEHFTSIEVQEMTDMRRTIDKAFKLIKDLGRKFLHRNSLVEDLESKSAHSSEYDLGSQWDDMKWHKNLEFSTPSITFLSLLRHEKYRRSALQRNHEGLDARQVQETPRMRIESGLPYLDRSESFSRFGPL